MEFKTVEVEATKVSTNGRLFGMFNVAQDLGHNMTKQQLIDIIKELDWTISQEVDIETYNQITRDTLRELEVNDTF